MYKIAGKAEWLLGLPLISAGIGAGAGALTSNPGERSDGAIRGGLIGGVTGMGIGALTGSSLKGISKSVINNTGKGLEKEKYRLNANIQNEALNPFSSVGINIPNTKAINTYKDIAGPGAYQGKEMENWDSPGKVLDFLKEISGYKSEQMGALKNQFDTTVNQVRDNVVQENHQDINKFLTGRRDLMLPDKASSTDSMVKTMLADLNTGKAAPRGRDLKKINRLTAQYNAYKATGNTAAMEVVGNQIAELHPQTYFQKNMTRAFENGGLDKFPNQIGLNNKSTFSEFMDTLGNTDNANYTINPSARGKVKKIIGNYADRYYGGFTVPGSNLLGFNGRIGARRKAYRELSDNIQI